MTNSVRTAQIVLVIGGVLLLIAAVMPDENLKQGLGIAGLVCLGVGIWDLIQVSRKQRQEN